MKCNWKILIKWTNPILCLPVHGVSLGMDIKDGNYNSPQTNVDRKSQSIVVVEYSLKELLRTGYSWAGHSLCCLHTLPRTDQSALNLLTRLPCQAYLNVNCYEGCLASTKATLPIIGPSCPAPKAIGYIAKNRPASKEHFDTIYSTCPTPENVLSCPSPEPAPSLSRPCPDPLISLSKPHITNIPLGVGILFLLSFIQGSCWP
jgi:hypothetical protein